MFSEPSPPRCFQHFEWLLSPPKPGSPQVTQRPSPRRAQKALLEALSRWMSCSWSCAMAGPRIPWPPPQGGPRKAPGGPQGQQVEWWMVGVSWWHWVGDSYGWLISVAIGKLASCLSHDEWIDHVVKLWLVNLLQTGWFHELIRERKW